MCAPVLNVAKRTAVGMAMQKAGLGRLGSVEDVYANLGMPTKKDPFGNVEIDTSKGRF